MAAINLLELFNGKFFRIPDYQRGYAWEEKQLQELWDDIEEISIENGSYKNTIQELFTWKKFLHTKMKGGYLEQNL